MKLLYDEVIFVIEGCFELTANGQKYEVRRGQMLWIPEGTELIYGGHAVFGYVVHPGNWKSCTELHKRNDPYCSGKNNVGRFYSYENVALN